MKNIILFAAAIGALFGVLIWKFYDDYLPALAIGCIGAALIIKCGYLETQRANFRKSLKKSPVPQDVEKFDNLLWKLDIQTQDWYLDNVCTDDDILNIVAKYRTKVREVWNAEDTDTKEQLRLSSMYTFRMETLMDHLRRG